MVHQAASLAQTYPNHAQGLESFRSGCTRPPAAGNGHMDQYPPIGPWHAVVSAVRSLRSRILLGHHAVGHMYEWVFWMTRVSIVVGLAAAGIG